MYPDVSSSRSFFPDMRIRSYSATLVLSALFALQLTAADSSDFGRPDPKFSVRVEKSVLVPMRDGVRLSTDLYFPRRPKARFRSS